MYFFFFFFYFVTSLSLSYIVKRLQAKMAIIR